MLMADHMNLDKYIDISMPLDKNTLVCPGDDPPQLTKVARQPESPVNFTWLNFGAHAGTHIDAPYYLFEKQWTCDQIPLSRLFGLCQILDLLSSNNIITANDLKSHKIKHKKVLLKTQNSYDKLERFHDQHIILSEDAAHYLIANGVETLGYDYQTFEKNHNNTIHEIFLSKNITLIDNLRLAHVEKGDYYLFCFPIKVIGIDAAPARAVLFAFE